MAEGLGLREVKMTSISKSVRSQCTQPSIEREPPEKGRTMGRHQGEEREDTLNGTPSPVHEGYGRRQPI